MRGLNADVNGTLEFTKGREEAGILRCMVPIPQVNPLVGALDTS
jgi:hypothetical protein